MPNIQKEEKMIHSLPNTEFKKNLREIGGTPEEVLNNKEVFKFFLPVIRADFKIVEMYNYTKKSQKFISDITVFNGKEDDISFGELVEWRNHTNKECKIYNFSGGHFFINDHTEEIFTIINTIFYKPDADLICCQIIVFLFFFSCVLFIIGMIKPTWVIRWGKVEN